MFKVSSHRCLLKCIRGLVPRAGVKTAAPRPVLKLKKGLGEDPLLFQMQGLLGLSVHLPLLATFLDADP